MNTDILSLSWVCAWGGGWLNAKVFLSCVCIKIRRSSLLSKLRMIRIYLIETLARKVLTTRVPVAPKRTSLLLNLMGCLLMLLNRNMWHVCHTNLYEYISECGTISKIAILNIIKGCRAKGQTEVRHSVHAMSAQE